MTYKAIAYFHRLCHLATFLYQNYYKGSQVTKPIILVKTCYKLLYVFKTSLIGDFLASADIKAFGCTYVGRAASYRPHTFFTPRVFC